MATYWWDLVLQYPGETAVFITAIIGGYLLYIEISKFWHKPLYITDYGKWRVHRYIGRIIKMEGQKSFIAQSPFFKCDPNITKRDFKCKIKIKGQPVHDMVLNTGDLILITKRKILMNKKYVEWDIKKAAYHLTNDTPIAYHFNPSNLERYMLHKIDVIDMRANKSAVASPQVVHNSVINQHLPLDWGEYIETADDTIFDMPTHIFDENETGGYERINDMKQQFSQRRRRKERDED